MAKIKTRSRTIEAIDGGSMEATVDVGVLFGCHSGVCGKCAREARIQRENNVTELEHHIACSSDTRAEIVVPVLDRNGEVAAVLDIDSVKADVFDGTDETWLEKICEMVSE